MYYGYAKLLCLESKFEVGKEMLLCNSVLYMNLLKLCRIEAWTSVLQSTWLTFLLEKILKKIYILKWTEKILVKPDQKQKNGKDKKIKYS